MKWYEIKNKGGDGEVYIYDEIGAFGVTAKSFIDELKSLKDVTNINLRINSPGGSVIDGIAIYNAVKSHPAKVNGYIDSVALSMGSVIAMAADYLYMPTNSLMMIHNPMGAAFGESKDLLKTVEVMDKMKNSIILSYMGKTGLSEEKLSSMMDDETWMSADEALELGFIDEVTGAVELAANFDLSGFNKTPESLKGKAAEYDSYESIVVKTLYENIDAIKEAVVGRVNSGEEDMATKEPTANVVDKEAILAEHKKENEARKEAIMELFTNYGGHQDLLIKCLKEDIDVNNARKLLLDEIGKDYEPVASDVRILEDSRDKFRNAALNSIEVRCGVTKDTGDNEYRSYTALDIARKCLEVNNISTKGKSKMDIVAAAFTHSTSDFPFLLENSLGKELQRAYGTFPETWTRIADTSSVPDFKVNPRIRLGSFNSLTEIKEGGEYTEGTFGEEKETIQAVTKGKIINLTRQAIINDDLGGFMRIAAMMGRAAARTIGNDVYNIFTNNPNMSDGIALFHASHSNLAGTGGAPTVTTVGAARAAMRKQQDLNSNDYLDIRPSVILSGVELEDTINVLMASETDPSQANSRRPNPIRGIAEVITDPRLNTTEWYLIADPSVVPLIEVAFLDGNQSPYLESQNGFTVDGTQWKVRLDYGTAPIDFRGGYKNAGV